VDFSLSGYLAFFRIAPKAKPAPAASADNTAADSSRSDIHSADSASDYIRLVMDQLQLLHTRVDEQARTRSELLHRDALRDHPVNIGTATPSHVDAPYMLIGELVPA
jgi:hypothetical protein